MFSWTRILALVKKEFLNIWKDPKSRAAIFILPLIQFFIYADSITLDIKNLNVVVCDRSHTQESRDLLSMFAHSDKVKSIEYTNQEKKIQEKLDLREAHLAIAIPSDFAQTIKQGKLTKVHVIVDGRQTSTALMISSFASQLVSTYANQIYDKLRLQGLKKGKVEVVVRNWFNSNIEYREFFIISIITVLILIITLILTALSISKEREAQTFDQLLVSPLSSAEILIGKTIPAYLSAMALTVFMIFSATVIFQIPFVGSIWLFLFVVSVSLFSMIGVGLFVSSICRTQQQSLLCACAFQMILILLSGFLSPVEDMPLFFRWIAAINPVRYQLLLSKGIFLKNMAFSEVCCHLWPMALIALTTLVLASIAFTKKLD